MSQATISRERTRNRGQHGDRHQQAERLASECCQAAIPPPTVDEASAGRIDPMIGSTALMRCNREWDIPTGRR